MSLGVLQLAIWSGDGEQTLQISCNRAALCAFLCAGDIVEARHDVPNFCVFCSWELLWKA